MLRPVPPQAVLPLLPVVYMMKADLHPLCRPAHITRLPGKVLVQVHFAALLAEVSMWAVETLTDAERIAVRLMYGVDPDLRVPFDDQFLDGYVADAKLPNCLDPETALLLPPIGLRSG